MGLAHVVLAAACLAAGADARAPASEDDASVDHPFLCAETGPAALVRDAGGARLGWIADYEIEPGTGRVRFVVVRVEPTSEGDHRLVPFDALRWDRRRRELVLPLTPEELRSLPMYLLEDEPGRGAGGSRGRPLPAGDEAPPLLTVGRAVGADVLLGSGEVARCEALVLDASRGRAVFALVRSAASPAEDPLVVPWSELAWRRTERHPRGRFSIAPEVGTLEAAFRLRGGDLRQLADPETVERILRCYRPAAKRGT